MASTKTRKLTTAQFRKEIRGYRRERLEALLEGVYKNCPDAASYLNVQAAGEAFEKALLQEAKEKVRSGFYTKSGNPRLNFGSARSAVDNFEKSGPSVKNLIDLRLCYIEYSAGIIADYTRLPDSLFNSTDRMIRAVIQSFNQVKEPEEGRFLADSFRDRLEKLANTKAWENDWFFTGLKSDLETITWLHPEPAAPQTQGASSGNSPTKTQGTLSGNPPSEIGRAAAPDQGHPEPAAAAFPPLTDTAAILSEEDGDLFYALWLPLLDFANTKLHVNSLHDLKTPANLDPGSVKEISNALLKNISLVDDYLACTADTLPPEHRSIIAGWKQFVNGKFVLERHLKKGSILISIDNNAVYQVRGIKSSLEEMFHFCQLPVLVEATILPYRGILIIDGVVSPLNIFLGGGIKREYKEVYVIAKRKRQLITSL